MVEKMVKCHRDMGINRGILVERDVEYQRWWFGGILVERMVKYHRVWG